MARDPSSAPLVMFALYSAAVFVIGWLSNRILSRRKFMDEYYLGSRTLGVMALTLSFGATSASAGSFVGFPSLVYSHGWVVALWIAGYMIVPLCSMGLLAKRLNQVSRRAGAITVPDLLRARFESRAAGIGATLLIIVMLSVYLIPQFKTAGIILDKLLEGVPVYHWASGALAGVLPESWTASGIEPGYLLSLGFFAVLVVLYTAFGGFRAVVWTDVLQGFVMVFGVVFMLVTALVATGGLGATTRKMAEMTPPMRGEIEFTASPPASGRLHVPAMTWVETDGRLIRTNADAWIETGASSSNAVNAVEITTPAEKRDIRGREVIPDLPAGVSVGRVEMKEYRYGHGKKGVYVSGPGPKYDGSGFMPLGLAVAFFLLWPLGGSGQPGNMVRLMAADGSRTIIRSVAALAVYYGVIYFPLVVIFCCARIITPGLEGASDRIMPEMAFTLADLAHVPWLAGLLVAAPFAAAMSTVDSFMLMISSAVVRDIYQREINPDAQERTVKRLGFGVTVLVGLVAGLSAINPPQYLQDVVVFASAGLTVSFLVPVGLAIYWPRLNTPGLLASMLGGFGAYTLLWVVGSVMEGRIAAVAPLGVDPLLWGVAASLLLGVATALATAPPPEHLVRRYFGAEA